MATVKVKRNVWGNYGCFIGTVKDTDFGCSYDAKEWLAGKMAEDGAKLSAKSDITAADLVAHKKWQDDFTIRIGGVA